MIKKHYFAFHNNSRRIERVGRFRKANVERLEMRQMLTALLTVGGNTWHDVDRDGIWDSTESPAPGLTAELYYVGQNYMEGDADDEFIGVAVSDETGAYVVSDVPPDRDYYFVYTPPEALSITRNTSGITSNIYDSDVDPHRGRLRFHVYGNSLNNLGVGLVSPPSFGDVAIIRAAESSANVVGSAMSRDDAGNLYIVGHHDKSVDFDPTLGNEITSAGAGRALYVAKYLAGGQIDWARNLIVPINGYGAATSVATDDDGNVFVGGNFVGTVDLDPTANVDARTSRGEWDGFVTKFDAGGGYLWTRVVGDTSFEELRSLATDTQGNVVGVGNFRGTVDFDPGPANQTLAAFGNQDAFLWKLDPAGDLVWAKSFRGLGNRETIHRIAVDANDDVVVVGAFDGQIDFDPSPLRTHFVTYAGGESDAFAARLASNGDFIWAKTFRAATTEAAIDLVISKSGNLYVTGAFETLTDFDPGVGDYLLDGDGEQMFVVALTDAGDFRWARGLPGEWRTKGLGVRLDDRENVYIAGSFTPFQTDDFDFDPTEGVFSFRPEPYPYRQHTRVFGLRLTSSGEFDWARLHGNTVRGFEVDDAGNAYLFTDFRSGFELDPGAGVFSAISQADVLAIAKFLPPGEIAGSVWNDLDGDGIRQAGEPPLPGVTVRLYETVDGISGNDNDVQSWPVAVSAADGSFQLTGVAPGTYYVRPDVPIGRRISPTEKAGGSSLDNDVSPVTGLSSTFAVTSNGRAEGIGVGLSAYAPLPRDDHYAVAEDGSLSVGAAQGVFGNDDRGATLLPPTVVSAPQYGAFELRADGGFDYRPNPDFSGVDSFSYLAAQSNGVGFDLTREFRRLARDTVEFNDRFAESVAIWGDWAIAGAPGDYATSGPKGSAYIYRWDGTSWKEHFKLQGTSADEWFGSSVDIWEDKVVVGAIRRSNVTAGRAYVFRRNGNTWAQEGTLSPGDAEGRNNFGADVAISGDNIVVAAREAAYIFRRSGGTWSQQARVTPPNYYSQWSSRVSVDATGDTVVVGVPRSDVASLDSGAAYVYVREGNNWPLQASVTVPDPTGTSDHFAWSVAVDGNTLVVGAPDADGHPYGFSSGAAYVFSGSGPSWSFVSKLERDIESAANFAEEVAVFGDVIAVGAVGDAVNSVSGGATHVFQQVDGRWLRHARAAPSDGGLSTALGRSVAVGAHTVLSGAYNGSSSASSGYRGAAYFHEFVRGAVAHVTLDVAPANDAPIARRDVYQIPAGQSLHAQRGIPAAQLARDLLVAADDYVYRVRYGLSSVEGILGDDSDSTIPRGIAFDPVERKIYGTNSQSDQVWRANYDGTAKETISTTTEPTAIVFDPNGRKLYWISNQIPGIWRSDLDGQNRTVLSAREELGVGRGLAIDPTAGKLYYTSRDSVRRVSLDGTSPEDLVTAGVSQARGIALDLSAGKMYWINARQIDRANLDGTSVETLVSSATDILAIAVDPAAGALFWAEAGSSSPAQRLFRAKLDGSSAELLLTDAGRVFGIIPTPALDYVADPLISRETVWRFLDNGSDQGTAWREPDFDHAGWRNGLAELGFGDGGDGRPEATTLNSGPSGNRYVTYYFRREFSVVDPAYYASLQLDLKRDDGAVVYLNGFEVLRNNMPSATVSSSTLASQAAPDDGANFIRFDIPSNHLAPGRNVIAVEIHQASRDSSDISFDLELTGSIAPNLAGVALANDYDADNSLLTATLVAPPHQGTLTFRDDGAFTYTPNPGFEGVDRFIYRASDGELSSPDTLVTINVGAANRPPSAADDRYVVRNNRTIIVSAAAGVLLNDFDLNGDEMLVALSSSPIHGSLSLAADGSFAYTPDPGFVGIDSFTYRLSDGSGAFAVATAIVHVVPQHDPINGIPLADHDVFDAAAGVLSVVSPGVLENDTDPEQRPLTAVVERSPWHGTLSFASDGSFTYTPLPGFLGQDTFAYRATDGNTFSMPATVVLNVTAPNPAAPESGVATGILPPTPPTVSAFPPSTIDSGTSSPGTTSTLPSFADLNGDGRVDRGDLAAVMAAYASTNLAADPNADGRVSLADAIVVRNAMASQSFEPGAIVQSSAKQLTPRAVDQALLYATRRFIRRSPAVNADVLGDLMASGSRDPSSPDSNCVRLDPVRRQIRDRR